MTKDLGIYMKSLINNKRESVENILEKIISRKKKLTEDYKEFIKDLPLNNKIKEESKELF